MRELADLDLLIGQQRLVDRIADISIGQRVSISKREREKQVTA